MVVAVLVALQATDVAQVVAHVTVEVDPDVVGVHVTRQALAVTVAEQPFEELGFEIDGGPGLEAGGGVGFGIGTIGGLGFEVDGELVLGVDGELGLGADGPLDGPELC